MTDISIFGFGGHIAISGCWLLLQSLAETFFHLSMVINPRFTVGKTWNINSLSYFQRYNYFIIILLIIIFGSHFRLSVIIGIA